MMCRLLLHQANHREIQANKNSSSKSLTSISLGEEKENPILAPEERTYTRLHTILKTKIPKEP
jgi:hypothetical protein